jgi:thiol:disulfide interchange protein DsbD
VAVANAGQAAPPQAARGGWEPYSPERLQALRAQGRPVFVNLTADWCITCLVNERVALGTDRVAEAFAKAGVVRLKGDWTRGDETITRLLAEHGRSGVPLYLYYPAGTGTRAAVLPQLLSPQTVLAALAGPTPSP